MQQYTIGKPLRFFFLISGSIIWTGIWLTGFSVVHWLLFVPAIFFYFAAITGICPGLIFSRFIFGDKPKD
jgi:hypothetical protein